MDAPDGFDEYPSHTGSVTAVLTTGERQARYQRMLVRWEKKARLKKAKKDAIWTSKPVDSDPSGVES